MKLKCFCFHKSGSMFFYRLFREIAYINNIDYYSVNKTSKHIDERVLPECMWNDEVENYILCPLRCVPRDYRKDLKYIIHFRNPLDTMISQYYSFGYTHSVPDPNSDKEIYDIFMKRRKIIQSQTIDEYCLSQENIDEINNKYNDMLIWINKYKNNENVFVSEYDNMYYDFSNWLRDIMKFLSVGSYDKLLDKFEKEFSNSSEEVIKSDVNTVKKHHRSGLSKQYLIELKKETIDTVISKFSNTIKQNINF